MSKYSEMLPPVGAGVIVDSEELGGVMAGNVVEQGETSVLVNVQGVHYQVARDEVRWLGDAL